MASTCLNEYTREEGGEEVQDGEGVKRLVHNVESGDLCGDATTPSEMTACLLEGGTLLRSVSDATCAALKVSAAECEEVHRCKYRARVIKTVLSTSSDHSLRSPPRHINRESKIYRFS